MLGFVVSLLVALEIHAAGGCPSAGEIERRLAPLLGPGPEARPEARTTDVATVTHDADGALAVALADARGGAIEERRLPPAATCRDGAETIAVTLAIWEAQIHPEISLRLDRLSPEAAAPVVVGAPPPPPSRLVSLGVAVAGDWQEGEGAPALRLELSAGRRGGRLRARLAAVGVGRHTIDVTPGQATWWRGYVALGGEGDLLRGRRGALALGVAATGGVAAISGSGYAVNRGTRSLDLGGEAWLRGVVGRGLVRPWLGVSVGGWLRRQQLELQGVSTASALPRWAPMAALGADVSW